MKRIKAIANLIHHCHCVYDFGSDHAFLSILLLRSKKNLQKSNLIGKTTNIINNGLKNITKKVRIKLNYIVIAGLGGWDNS